MQLTFTANPGKSVPWVELQPGKGFVVHLSEPAKTDISFTYWMLDGTGAV